MRDYFQKAAVYLASIDIGKADRLEQKANYLLNDENAYERASQALRRRFSRGASEVEGIDRGGRVTKIRREKVSGVYTYSILGSDGNWSTPEERIWVVSMYALWQDENKSS
jgi:hypothetical protein